MWTNCGTGSRADSRAQLESKLDWRVLLAVAGMPQAIGRLDDAVVKAVAAALGLAAADVRMRLGGVLPRVVASDADGDALAAAARALDALGLQTVTCDPQAAPGDDERIIGRRVEVDGDVLQVWDATQTCHECPRQQIALVQRGVRTSVEKQTVTTTQRRLDLGRIVMSGGLMLTKKTAQTSTQTTETRESFLLVQRADGAEDLILYERRLDYRFLGAAMQPSSHANFDQLVARVRAFCPGAPFDERVAQPAFVNALPTTVADPTDLALYLVALSSTAR